MERISSAEQNIACISTVTIPPLLTERELDPVAGDALELVQRAAGDAQPAPGDHRHLQPARGEGGGQHEGHLAAVNM